ncbi:unnamed protein product [Sympodiomycopsis kandeliae]
MVTATDTKTKVAANHDGNGVVKRKFDTDPIFNNAHMGLFEPGKIPYGKGQTYVDPNPSRAEYLKKTEGMTFMQRHCVFFDGSVQGIVTPLDTFYGFYALGFGFILSFIAIFVIHSAFSYPTGPRTGKWSDWIPDPYFRIWIANIHRNKHGSDTESYDRRGHFQKTKFEQVLDDYSSRVGRDSLSFTDGCVMLLGRRNLMDFFGIFAFIFEWGSTYYLLWPADGYMKKEDMIGVLNGSIFPEIAAARRSRGASKKK